MAIRVLQARSRIDTSTKSIKMLIYVFLLIMGSIGSLVVLLFQLDLFDYQKTESKFFLPPSSIGTNNDTTTNQTSSLHETRHNLISRYRQNYKYELGNFTATKGKWAYAFVLGGIGGTTKRKGDYHGFLYSIAVASYQLKHVLKSQADVVVFLQLSTQSDGSFPNQDIELLESIGVKVKFIPRFKNQTLEVFYSLMMEKFRILTLTEYSRVLFLDSDMMPLCNMDYLFELSESPYTNFKENIIIGWNGEPAHGGFFLMKPGLDYFQQIQEILLRREMEAKGMEYPHWDPIRGWGHIITPPDYIKTPMKPNAGTNWTWHGSYADQGVLLYYTKYFRKSVTIINDRFVDHWGTDENGTLQLESSSSNFFLDEKYSCKTPYYTKHSPYSDFMHFTGDRKPWANRQKEIEKMVANPGGDIYKQCLVRWFQTLEIVSKNISRIPIQWDLFWDTEGSVGKAPSFVQIAMYLRAREENGWILYDERDISNVLIA